MVLLLLLTTAALKAPVQGAVMTDEAVFRAALSGDAFVELRCHGIPAADAKRLYGQEFGDRQACVRAALSKRGMKGEEEVPIGYRCPYYDGTGKRLKADLLEAERRLRIAFPTSAKDR